jgi:hypothetical protein
MQKWSLTFGLMVMNHLKLVRRKIINMDACYTVYKILFVIQRLQTQQLRDIFMFCPEMLVKYFK